MERRPFPLFHLLPHPAGPSNKAPAVINLSLHSSECSGNRRREMESRWSMIVKGGFTAKGTKDAKEERVLISRSPNLFFFRELRALGG
jgi:hypothetical protein